MIEPDENRHAAAPQASEKSSWRLHASPCPSRARFSGDASASTFGIPGSGVEFTVETRDSGFGWRVREIYEVPDCEKAVIVTVEDVIARLMPGDEVEVTRLAV